jgi:hypothetical protein
VQVAVPVADRVTGAAATTGAAPAVAATGLAPAGEPAEGLTGAVGAVGAVPLVRVPVVGVPVCVVLVCAGAGAAVAGVWVVDAPTVLVAPPVQPAELVHCAPALARGSPLPPLPSLPPGLVVTVLVQAPVQWAEPDAVPLPASDPPVPVPVPVPVALVPVAVAAQLPEPARQPA